MVLRKATKHDINRIVEIHCDAFKGFFLTSLGPAFLKFYYGHFIKHPETITMVAEEDNVIYGFSAATSRCKGFNSRLIKSNLISFGLFYIVLLFTSPKSLLRLVKNLTKKSDEIEDDEDYAELYSIGVAKTAQGKGVGKLLLRSTESEMKVSGIKRLSLTTDYNNNDSTLAFYQAMGYNALYTFVAYPNRKMFRLIKNLDDTGTGHGDRG